MVNLMFCALSFILSLNGSLAGAPRLMLGPSFPFFFLTFGFIKVLDAEECLQTCLPSLVIVCAAAHRRTKVKCIYIHLCVYREVMYSKWAI